MTKRISGTKEWATHTANIDQGCEHDCLYCYAKASAIRFGQTTKTGWKNPEPRHKQPGVSSKEGTLMFPSAHDITESNVDRCVDFLKKNLTAGKNVLIVTKPHHQAMSTLMASLNHWKEQVLFRFTIGSYREQVLKFWEPGAPNYYDRIKVLRMAHDAGWKTSVSCEPMLDTPDEMAQLYSYTSRHITDSIWFGLMNKSMVRLSLNGHKDAKDTAEALLGQWTKPAVEMFYAKMASLPHVKWKDSVKQVMGIPTNEEAGMDV